MTLLRKKLKKKKKRRNKMAKKLAHKQTKELIPDNQIRERGLRKADFTPNWQGRISVINAEKSEIAKKIGITQKGEYAIKVR